MIIIKIIIETIIEGNQTSHKGSLIIFPKYKINNII